MRMIKYVCVFFLSRASLARSKILNHGYYNINYLSAISQNAQIVYIKTWSLDSVALWRWPIISRAFKPLVIAHFNYNKAAIHSGFLLLNPPLNGSVTAYLSSASVAVMMTVWRVYDRISWLMLAMAELQKYRFFYLQNLISFTTKNHFSET